MYHCTTWSRDGKPGYEAASLSGREEGRKALSACLRGQVGVLLEIVQGWRRLERSERGWPIVPLFSQR